MKPDIVNASIASIDSNPFRSTSKYPYVKSKIDALKRSIKAVGLWEGVIVRKRGNRYELAFGHHRIEAARQLGLTRIPVIVRADLDDEAMLQFMGRENTEDYNTDFLCMLETWEAAWGFKQKSPGSPDQSVQAIDVAKLLGWTRLKAGTSGEILNDTASACSAAYALIKGGYLARSDLAEMSVDSARLITERAHARMKQLDAMAKQTNRSPAEINRAKVQFAKAAKSTADKYRSGAIAAKDLRNEVDRRAYALAAQSKTKNSPLFATFADALVSQINKMLMHDSASEKLTQVVKALPNVTSAEDLKALRKIDFALAELEHECGAWRKKLARRGKVVPFLQLVKEG